MEKLRDQIKGSEGPRWTCAIQGATQTPVLGKVWEKEGGDQLALHITRGSSRLRENHVDTRELQWSAHVAHQENASRRMLKKAVQRGRSRRTGRRRTLRGTLRTCSRRERSWRIFSASCYACSTGSSSSASLVSASKTTSVSSSARSLVSVSVSE